VVVKSSHMARVFRFRKKDYSTVTHVIPESMAESTE